MRINSATPSLMHAVNPRNDVASMSKKNLEPAKTIGESVRETIDSSKPEINTDAHGALAKLREDMAEFTEGVLRPKTGIIGEKTYETSFSQLMKNLGEEHNGALAGFNDKLHGFAFGILRPETGIIGEEHFTSSNSTTLENIGKKHNGALTGFNDEVHGFAFGILRPETGVIGEEHFTSSNSTTLENLSKEHIGAAAGIKNALREYAKTAAESVGPPAALAEPLKVLHYEDPDISDAKGPRSMEHLNDKK